MPVIASKVQDLMENLIGREIRFSQVVPLILYILDIIMISVRRRAVVTFESTQKCGSSSFVEINSSFAALKAILQIFHVRLFYKF
jgi:hypothetical protein